MTAPDNVANQFGTSVATEGNTMVVGAPYDTDGTGGPEGAAFVYTQTGPGTWSYLQTLIGNPDPNTGHSEMFGTAVAIYGDTVVIGAPAAANDTGAAYVFTRPGPGADWAQTQTLTDSRSRIGSYFGAAVAIDGGTIVVGAWDDDPTGNSDDNGAAYVYTEPSPGFGFGDATQLTAPTTGDSDDQFGYAVAVSGQTVYVGAQSYNHAEGAVYGYTEADTDDGWATDVTQTTLLPPTPATGQAYGSSLAVRGNTLVVGDEALAEGTTMNVGAAFVYTVPTAGDLASAVEDAELQPSATGSTEPFWGGSVAIDGSTIVVGSGQGNPIAGDYPYVYTEPNGGGWSSATGTALPLTPGVGGVAVSGDTVVIGQQGNQDGDVVSFSQPATKVSVALAPISIVADGVSTSVATATATGASGDPATADNVTFSAGGAGVAIGPVTNNGDGTYTATLTSSTTPGLVTITATDTSITPSVTGQATLTQTSASTGGGGSGGSGGSGGGGSSGGSGSGSGGSGSSGGGASGSGSGGSGSGSSGTGSAGGGGSGSSGSGSGSGSGSSGGSSGGSGGSGSSPMPTPTAPTSGELGASLEADLAPAGKDATLKAVLKAGGIVFTYKAPEAGQLTIDWYLVPAGAHLAQARKKAPKPILVADGSVKFRKAGASKIKVSLTAAGRKLFKRSRKLTLTAKASLSSTGSKPATVDRAKTFTLR